MQIYAVSNILRLSIHTVLKKVTLAFMTLQICLSESVLRNFTRMKITQFTVYGHAICHSGLFCVCLQTHSDKASVVFIDRSLDLASVSTHNTESLLDRIQHVLPRLHGHVLDVSLDMSPLCSVHR